MKKAKAHFIRNPFRVEGVVQRSRVIKGRRLVSEMVDPETGEALPLFTVDKATTELHDSKSYCKLFIDSWEILMKLTDAGRRLLIYVISIMKVNWDTVFINPDDAVLKCNMSKATFYRVIEELIEARILARKTGSHLEYWINPNILFNGNRVKLFNHHKLNVQANESRRDETTPYLED